MARQETVSRNQSPDAQQASVGASLHNAGRSYKNITEALTSLPEISSSIESKTGWEVDLSRISFEVVTAKELQRRCLEDVTRRIGIPTAVPESFVGRALANTLLSAYHRSVVALYLPFEKVIVINEERSCTMSQDAVKSALHHELTHVAQHQRYPKFMASVDRLAREQRLLGKHGGDLPLDERERQLGIKTERVLARMTLIEAQAMALQKMYEQEAGLHSEIKMGPVEAALGLTSMLIPGGMRRISQYLQGQAIFERIHALEPQEVDYLFKYPRAADLVFGSRGRVREAA
jgi:hypothetical protein